MEQLALRLSLPECTRVYLRAGSRRAHLIMPYQSTNSTVDHSLCGKIPWPTLWYGTGSQSEEDRAAELPLCKACEQADKRYRELLQHGQS